MTHQEITELYSRHADMVYRVCFLFLKNEADTQDMVQNTFVKLIQHPQTFQNPEHEKAWLIVTASNLCRDFLRHWWRKTVSLSSVPEEAAPSFPIDETLQQVLSLPGRYKMPVYLYYYEGYSCAEVAAILHKKESTVRGLLRRGRLLLKLELEGDIQ